MRTRLKSISPGTRLARVLAALEQELIAASDTEIREAAEELGMDLDMKGSAAFAGLKFPAKPSIAEYFGPEALAQLRQLVDAEKKKK